MHQQHRGIDLAGLLPVANRKIPSLPVQCCREGGIEEKFRPRPSDWPRGLSVWRVRQPSGDQGFFIGGLVHHLVDALACRGRAATGAAATITAAVVIAGVGAPTLQRAVGCRRTRALNCSITASVSLGSSRLTKPKPRQTPVSRSRTTLKRTPAPTAANMPSNSFCRSSEAGCRRRDECSSGIQAKEREAAFGVLERQGHVMARGKLITAQTLGSFYAVWTAKSALQHQPFDQLPQLRAWG